MWESFIDAMKLFVRGKLFRDLGSVVRQTLIGNAVGAIALVGLVKVGFPLLFAVIVASLIAGALQPWLFKDLKYA